MCQHVIASTAGSTRARQPALELSRLFPLCSGNFSHAYLVHNGEGSIAAVNEGGIVEKRLWLKMAAGLSFFMAACQLVISVWPAAAEYFQAPPALLNDRVRLFVIGGAAALFPVLFALYALSGAGVIRRLPLLRTALIGIGSLFLLRGLFIILTLLVALGILEGRVSLPGVASHLIFLSAGLMYLGGARLNWKTLKNR